MANEDGFPDDPENIVCYDGATELCDALPLGDADLNSGHASLRVVFQDGPGSSPSPTPRFSLDIGNNAYELDFKRMVQHPKGRPNRTRRIRRQVKANLKRSKSFKGQAGMKFS